MKKLAFYTLVFAMTASSHAAIVSLGNFAVNDIMILDVTEDTLEAGDLQDFGGPSVVGNTLDFDPIDFQSFAGSAQSHENRATLSFTLMAKPGQVLENAVFREGGDWTIVGPDATASYDATITWSIIEANHVPVTPMGGVANFGGSFSATGTAVNWDSSTLIDFQSALGGATKVEFSVVNVLTTEAGMGSAAFIAKKDVGLDVVANVPEPAALGVLLMGLGTASLLHRKRSRQPC